MRYEYAPGTDSFGTEYADVTIFDDNGDFKAAFIAIPAEDGMDEEYVQNHLEELAERFKYIPYVSPDERLDKVEAAFELIADAILHPLTSSTSIWAALITLGKHNLDEVPNSIRSAVEKLLPQALQK